MGGMKTLLRAFGFCTLIALGAPAEAEEDIVATFATCTGRLSALMEHQWLMSDAAADVTQARRAQMESLLFSVMLPGAGERTLARRIDAKVAMAALLTRVDFNDDPADAAWAATRVEIQIAACDALLLS